MSSNIWNRKSVSREKGLLYKVACLAVVAAVVACAYALPLPAGLAREALAAIFILISGIFLWVTEPMPIAISALLLCTFYAVLGIVSPTELWSSWFSSAVVFLICSFGMTAALLRTRIPDRILAMLLKRAGTSGNRVILAFVAFCLLMSVFVADVPCCAMIVGIALSVIKTESCEKGTSRFAKALMICVPLMVGIGGFASPAGSPLNVMANNILQQQLGYSIPFIPWMLVTIPTVVIVAAVAYVALVSVIKPEDIRQETVDVILGKLEIEKKWSAIDKKVAVIMGATIAVWLATTWTGWDITIIAVISTCCLFLPGVDVLDWKRFKDAVLWDSVILVGSTQAMCGAIVSKGAAAWFVGSVLVGTVSGVGPLLALVSFVAPLVRIAVPAGAAYVMVVTPSLIEVALAAGIDPVLFVLLAAFAASSNLLLAIDNMNLISYSHRYYSIWEFFKVGVFAFAAVVLCFVFVMPGLVSIML